MSLDMLKPGAVAVVTGMDCPEPLRGRLVDFGLVSGTKVRCRYQSPRGDVRALEIRGAVVAVRTSDLRAIAGRLL